MSSDAETPSPLPPASRWRWWDALALAVVSVAAIAAVSHHYSPRLSFSDEIVYACIARNIAEGRGLVASHYVPWSILGQGYPSLYLHMPGHPLMVAPALLVFGAAGNAIYVANWASYVAVGLILYALGAWLWSRSAGLLAALLYYACPTQLTLANTVMSEPTLALLTAIFLAVWLRAMAEPRRSSGLWLAAGLVAGMIHHETFLVFLPASLAVTFRVAPGERRRFLAAFAVGFAVLMALVFWPLHQARALEGHYAAGLSSRGLVAAATSMLESLGANLVDLVSHRRGGASGTLATQLPYIALAVLLGATRWLGGRARWVLGFTASGFALMFLGLAPFYPLVRIGPKHLLLFVPGMCLLFARLIDQIPPRLLRRGVAAAVVALLAYSSHRDVAREMYGRQARSYAHEAGLSETIRRYTAGLHPRTALVENAFLYGWEAWPVDVVFFGSRLDAHAFDRLDERVPIDVVALPGPLSTDDPPPLGEALLARGFHQAGVEGGLWVYLAPRLLQ